MDKIVIVGSGASGVHFALTVLQKGYDVLMLDVGRKKSRPVNPGDSFNSLKANLDDPVEYFLGKDYEGVLLPGNDTEYYGFPPSKNYIFSQPYQFKYKSAGFAPLFSFAQGGLAEAWTAGVYPFNDPELSDFPFCYNEIEPYYNEVARRIGIGGVQDDLARFFPFHAHIMEPLELDEHSKILLAAYEEHKEHLNVVQKCYLGRSRIATLSRDQDARPGCQYLGRCLWGCPSASIYTPLITLNQCQTFSNFKYLGDVYVDHFKYDAQRRITRVIAESSNGKQSYEFPVDKLVLAAGTLASSRIFLESVRKNTGEIVILPGLMDNRQILVPFINLKLIGESYHPDSYQYHQISMGLEREKPEEYVHCQITTLKTAMIHPIIQNMPLDLRTSIFVFRNLHKALGLVNVNLHDVRRNDNYLTLEAASASSRPRLVIHYAPASHEPRMIKQTVKRVKGALRKLGCMVAPGMTHIRPMGASVHYAGTIPMSAEKSACTSSTFCQSHDFSNLYFADGTTFPFLPAKNITFTLMANAVRVAESSF